MQCDHFGCGRFGSKKFCGRFGCGRFGVWPFWPGSDKIMAAISQTTCSNTFPWMKIFEFQIKFHWNIFLGQCCRKCKILVRLRDHLRLIVGWSISVLGIVRQSVICWDQATNHKNGQNGPNGLRILLRHNGHLISVCLWNRLSTFILKHFLQKLKNPLVDKRTIYGRTLCRPLDSWVAFGDRATVFQHHCLGSNRQYVNIGSDNGLAPSRQQTIIWTNADPVHWCIYAVLGVDELTVYNLYLGVSKAECWEL